jgi:hypothetical protein
LRFLFLILILFSCATKQKKAFYESLEISENNPDGTTALAHETLKKLVFKYDLHSFFYTKKLILDSKEESIDHPVLTLNTKYAAYAPIFLSNLLHEELHWWMDLNNDKVAVAIPDLKRAFRNPPGIKGAADPLATYRHLLICWMEYMAVTKYMGEDVAKTNLKHFIDVDKKFPWIYTQVLNHSQKIWDIVGKHNFIPDHLFQQINIIR